MEAFSRNTQTTYVEDCRRNRERTGRCTTQGVACVFVCALAHRLRSVAEGSGVLGDGLCKSKKHDCVCCGVEVHEHTTNGLQETMPPRSPKRPAGEPNIKWR
jgi:hypothetical protein